MRYNINVLWVEDTRSFYEEEKDILEMFATDNGINVNFEYIEDAKVFFNAMERQKDGFQKYDICFIDYNLSLQSDKFGDSVIKKLRGYNVCTDILFYSADDGPTIKEIVKDDFSSFEGVYVTNREHFDDKSQYLLNKNAKKLYSINNIRGLLMNETSENDYIMKSYLLRKYSLLKDDEKKELAEYIKSIIIENDNNHQSNIKEALKLIDGNTSINVNALLKLPSDILSLNDRYELLKRILNYLEKDKIDSALLDKYLNEIVSMRNKLAHRKLEVCKANKQVMHYSSINDFEQKKCNVNCTKTCEHSSDNRVSVETWNDVKKELKNFGQQMDELYIHL